MSNEMKNAGTRYFVVAAPGFYGERTRVQSSHSSISAARKNAPKGYVVRVGGKKKGDEFLRVYEEAYPAA